MQQSFMLSRQWNIREVADFNALHSRNPFTRKLANRYPEKVAKFYVLRWTTEKNVQRSAVHFCKGEANWRAEVFKDSMLQAVVETRFGTAGETHVLLDGRQRSGCKCYNCVNAMGDLVAIEKQKQISAARARKLARAG